MKTLWEKQKLLLMSNFSFSHSVFSTYLENFLPFSLICNCRLQTLSVWKRLKFVIWERTKLTLKDYSFIKINNTGINLPLVKIILCSSNFNTIIIILSDLNWLLHYLRILSEQHLGKSWIPGFHKQYKEPNLRLSAAQAMNDNHSRYL